MSARDRYHNQVKNALVKDGWTIMDDPLRLEWGRKDAYVDLGAEQIVAAEKAQRKIAVEIKTFLGASEVRDLENAYGQYMLYQHILEEVEPERVIYLAVTQIKYGEVFEDSFGKLLLNKGRIRLIVFDPQTEMIQQWIP